MKDQILPEVNRRRGTDYSGMWEKRNRVMHDGWEIGESEARELVKHVTDFIENPKNKGKSNPK